MLQEEVDTRVFLDAANALKNHHNISIHTFDTDALVLAVSFCHTYYHKQVQIWLAYSSGVNFTYILGYQLSKSLGPRMATALPGFHAFNSCDTMSCFSGRRNKTAFITWRSYPEATKAVLEHSSSSSIISNRCSDGRLTTEPAYPSM